MVPSCSFSFFRSVPEKSVLQRMECTLAVWEGPTKLLLAKVKNASGRIGIFLLQIQGCPQEQAAAIFRPL